MNCYEILGLNYECSSAEIKSAYRKLARQYHPDLHPNDEECAKKFKEIKNYDLNKKTDELILIDFLLSLDKIFIYDLCINNVFFITEEDLVLTFTSHAIHSPTLILSKSIAFLIFSSNSFSFALK